MLASTPKPPYYAVIFSNTLKDDTEGYQKTAHRMMELAEQYPGFLGVESARNDIGITVSYWKDLESIREWKSNVEHIEAQKLGNKKWYKSYRVRIAKVEREYGI